MKNLIQRLLFIPVTGFFLIGVCQYIYPFFSYQIYSLELDSELRNSIHIYFTGIFTIFILLWVSCLFIIELLVYLNKFESTSRFLKHLRYAPIAVFVFTLFAIPIFDLVAIQYSKYEIRNYVYVSSNQIEKPDLKLHNNYRGWCGNGAISHRNYLYFETAAEGFNDENPYIRAKALLVSSTVNNSWNGGDQRFNNYLKKSCNDKSNIVRKIANNYLLNEDSNCKIYLSKQQP